MADRTAGFTLIEVVTALGVFSIGAIALMQATGENARAASALHERAFAGVVADNQLALAFDPALALQPGILSGSERAAGVEWAWTRTVTPTDDPALVRVQVTVRRSGEDRVAAELISLRAVL